MERGDVDPLQLLEEVEAFIASVTSALPARKQQLEAYCRGQVQDAVSAKLQDYCKNGWLRKHQLELALQPYWSTRGSITQHEDLLLYNGRIMVPAALQKETMDKVHAGHQGIEWCRLRVKYSVWRSGVMT